MDIIRSFLIFILAAVINGCSSSSLITVPLDSSLLKEDEATIIIFHEQGMVDDFSLYIDRQPVGLVTSEKPLKLSVKPGIHEVYGEIPLLIRRATTQEYKSNEIYYMRLWVDFGMWVSSVRVEPTFKREEYEVESYH
ncbi:hypothetical protein AB6E79_25170 [Vibrio lentus]